jgi:hypothetical protein
LKREKEFSMDFYDWLKINYPEFYISLNREVERLDGKSYRIDEKILEIYMGYFEEFSMEQKLFV